MPKAERKEHTMSDERDKKRKEHEDGEPDVEAHIFDGDDLGEPDPEKKRKLGDFDVEDGEDAELGRKRK